MVSYAAIRGDIDGVASTNLTMTANSVIFAAVATAAKITWLKDLKGCRGDICNNDGNLWCRR